ncbi:unnamed protein product [Phaeothamnion confervicola]
MCEEKEVSEFYFIFVGDLSPRLSECVVFLRSSYSCFAVLLPAMRCGRLSCLAASRALPLLFLRRRHCCVWALFHATGGSKARPFFPQLRLQVFLRLHHITCSCCAPSIFAFFRTS